MKKLFSIKDEGSFWVEVENKVYSFFNKKSNSHRFFDVNGNTLDDYRRPKIETSDEQPKTDLEYDEEDEEYYCSVNMDEDDMARFIQSDYKSCPYYKSGDEYKVVRHQM